MAYFKRNDLYVISPSEVINYSMVHLPHIIYGKNGSYVDTI